MMKRVHSVRTILFFVSDYAAPKLTYLVVLLGLIVVLMGALACMRGGGVKVDLDKRTDIPVVQTIAESGVHSQTSGSLRLAITGLLSPTETIGGYKEFIAYLERALGQQVKLVQRGTYAEVNALIQAREVDLALVCPLPYVQGRRAFGMELVAAVVHRGHAAHYSYLVVSSDSAFTSLPELRGRTFAFSDPNSNSGWLVPVYQLALLGETPGSFFSGTMFTYPHTESLRAVADRLVDGAAVDSLVYDYISISDPKLVAKTKVIVRWGPYPSPAFVVHPELGSSAIERLRHVLLNIERSDEGLLVLSKLKLDGFSPIPDDAYDKIRDMESYVKTSIRR